VTFGPRPGVDPANGSRLFDQDAFADVIIKSGHLEIKCHRNILSTASDYFKTLLSQDPKHSLAERSQTVIELKDDAPEAIRAILQYIYSFKYERTVKEYLRDDGDVGDDEVVEVEDKDVSAAVYHLQVYVAAQKYLLQKLADKALDALKTALTKITERDQVAGKGLFELVKLLAECQDHNDSFLDRSNDFISRYLSTLMGQKAFRLWYEEDENSSALGVVLGSFNTLNETSDYHQIKICRQCGQGAIDTDTFTHTCRALGRHVSSANSSWVYDVGHQAGKLVFLR